jgi:diguanylate cyclase (GGDEF)-like protein
MGVASWKLNRILVSTIKAERDNDHRARHDALTGLSNRAGLTAAVERTWAAERDGGQRIALLFLDLDGFKGVNDTFGHSAGDALLELVAGRLNRVGRGNVAARIGGDEFVILTDTLDPIGVLRLGQRLIAEIAGRPYRLDDGSVVEIGVSVGIAFAPEHGHDFNTLLAAADAALYEAKAKGKSRCALAVRRQEGAGPSAQPSRAQSALSGEARRTAA